MYTVCINNKDYELKYTIESWKKLKSSSDVTPNNIQEKLNQDFASVISSVIYYGMSPSDRALVTLESLDLSFGFEVMDIVMPAIIASMPKSGKSSEGDEGQQKK